MRRRCGRRPAETACLIAARRRFHTHSALSHELPEPYRLVGVEFSRFSLYGVYMPNLREKVPYWEALIARLMERTAEPVLAIGDFNTCRAYVDEPGAIDATAHFMDKIEAIGFCDLWRRRYPEGREFSWYSTRGNGFRIDHAFLSPVLAARAGPVRYSHEERLAGLSDHSPLIVELPVAFGPLLFHPGRQVVAPVAPGVPTPRPDGIALFDDLFDLDVDVRHRPLAIGLLQVQRVEPVPDHRKLGAFVVGQCGQVGEAFQGLVLRSR